VVTADLQHLLKNKEATIAQLNSRLTATAGGKTLEASITELRERLATAEAVGRASNHIIDRAREEDEEYKRWMLREKHPPKKNDQRHRF
jgi:hypothetical protein